jgi:hypothetical protein
MIALDSNGNAMPKTMTPQLHGALNRQEFIVVTSHGPNK